MPEANLIREHMEVLGSDGGHVGIVGALDGDRIRLARSDSGDGQHRYVSTALVQDIRGNSITLTMPAADATDDGDRDPPIEDPQIEIATKNG